MTSGDDVLHGGAAPVSRPCTVQSKASLLRPDGTRGHVKSVSPNFNRKERK